MTVTNNFMYNWNESDSDAGFYAAVICTAGNDDTTQPGSVTIAGNTMYGLRTENEFTGPCYGIYIAPTRTYKQQNFVIKNNIIHQMHGTSNNFNIEVTYAPSNWVANGNVFDANGAWKWNGTKYTTLSGWQTASGEDANSSVGDPNFVDEANADLHLHASDTAATGAGVDISSITDHDYDDDARDANTITAGADVP